MTPAPHVLNSVVPLDRRLGAIREARMMASATDGNAIPQERKRFSALREASDKAKTCRSDLRLGEGLPSRAGTELECQAKRLAFRERRWKPHTAM